MGPLVIALLVLLAVLVFVGFFLVGIYNTLVGLRNRFKNAFAQVDARPTRPPCATLRRPSPD